MRDLHELHELQDVADFGFWIAACRNAVRKPLLSRSPINDLAAPPPSSFIPALVGLAAAVAKIFWLIVFEVNEKKFRTVELRKH